MTQQDHRQDSDLSVVSALWFFLKGNMLFATTAIILHTTDIAGAIFPPLFQKVYTDNILTHKNPEWFSPLITLYVILFLMELAVWVFVSITRRKAYSREFITVSSRYLWSVFRMPMGLIEKYTPGELAARYTTIKKTVESLDHVFPSAGLFFIMTISCYLIVVFNWKLGLIEVCSMVLLVSVIRITSKKQKSMAMDMEVAETRLQNVTMTGMSNMETIKSLGSEEYFFTNWENTYEQSMNTRVKTTANTIFLSSIPVLVLQFNSAALLCLGSWFILQGELTPGMLLASQALVTDAINPMNRVIDSVLLLLRINSSIKRIKDVTDDGAAAPALLLPGDDALLNDAKLTGEIELRDVTFGYDRSLPPLLTHFSLKINAGERIALVGHSGCGKSTILSLVSGLYEPWEGEVLFDGKPLKAIDRMAFLNSVSVVNQDVTLFEGTIADNVKMWDNSIEDFAMILACNDARVHHEIMERPGAYNGAVSAGGRNFSGGQRQRIEIATALAKDPTILLMDEGTSALDPQTEAQVMNSIYDQGMTLIMIAHRLETIARCDQIYVIEHGGISQHGTHEELLQMDGLYSDLLKYA